ncbi:DUF547 domain-containing protein [Crocosphaera sp. Alani8]|uniref:DUF547 domain-containing protein n=1 Tax=Crocosphaera sp. Alani8 TaxID=3038952 RepID=UPI00313A828D
MNRRVIPIILLLTAWGIASCATVDEGTQSETSLIDQSQIETIVSANPFDYQDYATVLETYVNEGGLVDYEGLQANREQLDRFNRSLGEVTPEVYNSWSEEEKLAFLINAYNSFTLESIIDQNPLKASIREIPGVWKRRKFFLTQTEKTLDNIEHDVIRQEFNEPRIHAALVCAAISCPPLRNEPYLPERLDAQLEDQSEKWIASSHGFQIDRQNNSVAISAIFKWFGEDWLETYSTEEKFAGSEREKAALNFISQYVPPEIRTYLAQGNYRINYLDYDWSLNKQN